MHGVKYTGGFEYWTSLVFDWSEILPSTNGQVFERHLNTILNLKQYSDQHLNTLHLNTRQFKACYSDVSVIQAFIIQIPTVNNSKVRAPDLVFPPELETPKPVPLGRRQLLPVGDGH